MFLSAASVNQRNGKDRGKLREKKARRKENLYKYIEINSFALRKFSLCFFSRGNIQGKGHDERDEVLIPDCEI